MRRKKIKIKRRTKRKCGLFKQGGCDLTGLFKLLGYGEKNT